MNIKAIREKIWRPRNDIDAPSKDVLFNWVREGDDPLAPIIDMVRYRELLSVLPDNIVENLEKARLSRAGLFPMLKAGLGAVDMLSSIIVDGSPIASSSAEAKLAPTLKIGGNYMQPGGIPGKSLRVRLRGRQTTLATAATIVFRFRIALTDIITGTIIMASDPITQDAAAQTNTQWKLGGDIVVRGVGSTGTVFAQGDADMASAALTVAAQTARFMGSAGAAVPAAATWDMNNDQFLQFTGQWSLATAYSIQTHTYTLEALN